MNVIYPYCKGALFDYIKVQTLVVYATIVYATTKVFVVGSFRYCPKTCQKPLAKTPQKPHADKNLFGSAKNFYNNINIKILNNNKNSLILPNKTKTFIMKQLLKTDYVIYNIKKNEPCLYEDSKAIVIFGLKEDAESECMFDIGEIPMLCTDIPKRWQNILLQQINN